MRNCIGDYTREYTNMDSRLKINVFTSSSINIATLLITMSTSDDEVRNCNACIYF